MKSTKEKESTAWREHIAKAKAHPEGIGAYCKAQGLAASSYYNWRKRLFGSMPRKINTSKKKKGNSLFVPVVVEAPVFDPLHQSNLHRTDLPNARWVSDIITNVIRGLI